MITSNVIHRTFRLKWGDGLGTCFTIDVEGRQYLVTARHLVRDLGEGTTARIELFHEGEWKWANVHVAWLSDPRADAAILAAEVQLSPNLNLEPNTRDMVLGQQVYFCGFTDLAPQGLEDINRGFPVPLVRQGILAGWVNEGGIETLVIDGHNIQGFSGGPVVFQPPGTRDFRVAGVVAGYHALRRPVFLDGNKTDYYVKDNVGLVVAHSFEAGVQHVTANPTGFEIVKD